MPTFWGLRVGPLLWCGFLALAGCLFYLVVFQNHPVPLQPVAGKITYRGLPVQTGMMVFVPDAARGNTGALAIGQIHADGTYTLKTGDAHGVAPGWYRVTVASISPLTLPVSGPTYRIPQSLLPEKYRDPDLSTLTCEVKPKSNQIDFDLE